MLFYLAVKRGIASLGIIQRHIKVKPRHLVPQPKVPSVPRAGLDGLIDSLLAAQHVLEMFRRTLPNDTSRHHLDRLSNRLTKIVTEARNLTTPLKWAEIGRLSPSPAQGRLRGRRRLKRSPS
jgi:hypothetical protein